MRAAFHTLLHLARLCIMTYTLSCVGVAVAAGPDVWIALSEPGGAHASAAVAVETEVRRQGGSEILLRPWRELDGVPPRLVVAIGMPALRGMVERGLRVPILAVLVPEAAYEHLVAEAAAQNRGNLLSAVLIDQPPARQMAALRLALPDSRRIGALFGPESRRLAAGFQRAAADSGLALASGQVDAADRVGIVLQKVVDDSDVLLAVADPTVYNNATVPHVLTAAYRRRVPVIGFSPPYVRAGALLALYSTPEQLGHQAGETARAFLAGRPLPPPQAPREFTIAINTGVARSLGIALKAEDGAALAAQLKAREPKR